jgi:hypothetical protein
MEGYRIRLRSARLDQQHRRKRWGVSWTDMALETGRFEDAATSLRRVCLEHGYLDLATFRLAGHHDRRSCDLGRGIGILSPHL